MTILPSGRRIWDDEDLSVGLADLTQAVLNGILNGGFLALASVGLSLIFGVQRILNVAQGAFIVVASFLTFQFSTLVTPAWHLDPLFSIILDFFAMGAIGGLCYFALIYKIESTGFEAPLLATFGLSVFIEYVVVNGLSFSIPIGSHSYGLSLIPALIPATASSVQVQNTQITSGAFTLGNIVVQEPLLLAFLIAILVIPLTHFFFTRTYYGKAIRATAQDWQAAEFSGIDIRITRLMSFVMGSGLAGVAGGVYVYTSSVSPSSGDTYLLPLMLAVIIVGGVGSILGTLVGGFIVGLIISISNFVIFEVVTQVAIPKDFGYAFAFIFFLVVLMIRPTGLFGHAGRV
ncbi:MAG: branched-chain amino acid ABC transporter permease [Thaumarchaeota archaeon]|nr:branched-chain amino acid ABC transporter permease [Nitrososphaerota archaeon]